MKPTTATLAAVLLALQASGEDLIVRDYDEEMVVTAEPLAPAKYRRRGSFRTPTTPSSRARASIGRGATRRRCPFWKWRRGAASNGRRPAPATSTCTAGAARRRTSRPGSRGWLSPRTPLTNAIRRYFKRAWAELPDEEAERIGHLVETYKLRYGHGSHVDCDMTEAKPAHGACASRSSAAVSGTRRRCVGPTAPACPPGGGHESGIRRRNLHLALDLPADPRRNFGADAALRGWTGVPTAECRRRCSRTWSRRCRS